MAGRSKYTLKYTDHAWIWLREEQAKALSLPNTGMVTAIDLGSQKHVHPAFKKDVGVRLAKLALNRTYGKDIIAEGPLYLSSKVIGNTMELSF